MVLAVAGCRETKTEEEILVPRVRYTTLGRDVATGLMVGGGLGKRVLPVIRIRCRGEQLLLVDRRHPLCALSRFTWQSYCIL